MVFSGIIQCRGRIENVMESDSQAGRTFVIRPETESFLGKSVSVGSSISVDGVCLTVTELDDHVFRVDVAPETLKRTHFSSIVLGDAVNLENALQMSDRNSGHTVQGHVDGVGKIVSVIPDGISLRFTISTRSISLESTARSSMNALIVPKGFIAVDGASLTVCEVNRVEEWFTLMLIPHTQAVLKPWQVGQFVNLELDCLAKYVTASLEGYLAPVIEKLRFRSQVSEVIAVASMGVSILCLTKLLARR